MLTDQQREQAQAIRRKAELDCARELIDLGFDESTKVRLRNGPYATIGLDCPDRGIMWASDIGLRLHKEDSLGERRREINSASSGGFTPEDLAQATRTRHAALVLNNWKAVFEIVEKYSAIWIAPIETPTA